MEIFKEVYQKMVPDENKALKLSMKLDGLSRVMVVFCINKSNT